MWDDEDNNGDAASSGDDGFGDWADFDGKPAAEQEKQNATPAHPDTEEETKEAKYTKEELMADSSDDDGFGDFGTLPAKTTVEATLAEAAADSDEDEDGFGNDYVKAEVDNTVEHKNESAADQYASDDDDGFGDFGDNTEAPNSVAEQ